MSVIQDAIAAIEGQQPKERSAVWMVGEQLKDMVRGNEAAAALLLTDLTQNKEMTLAVAEAKKDAETEKAEALGKKAEELKKAKDELKKAKDEMAAAAEALKKAEEEREALRETLEKEKKSAAAMDNKALAEFGVLFRQAQETVNRMTEIADELDDESRPKIYRALDALAQLIREKAGEAV